MGIVQQLYQLLSLQMAIQLSRVAGTKRSKFGILPQKSVLALSHLHGCDLYIQLNLHQMENILLLVDKLSQLESGI